MFNIFRNKTPLQKLQIKYKKIMEEAHSLSKTNRKASDAKYAEAEEVAKEIEKIPHT